MDCWKFQRDFAIEIIDTPLIDGGFTYFENNFVTLTVRISRTYGPIKSITIVNSIDDTIDYYDDSLG